MSIRRRSAKRITDPATAIYDVREAPPRLDRTFVISFLEIDPEVAAAINGEAPEPRVINADRGPAQPPRDYFASPADSAERRYEEWRHAEQRYEEASYARSRYQEPRYRDDAQVIDISSSVEPVTAWDGGQPARSPRPAKRPKARKAPARRPTRTRSRAAADAERIAAIKEVRLRPVADRIAAAQATHTAAPEALAPVQEPVIAPVTEPIFHPVERVIHTQPVAPPAPATIRPPAGPRPAVGTKHLPIAHVNHEKLLVQVAQIGWKIPPATRRQWSYMNFTMPPDPKANMTPRQIKRQEWRDMMKYFRISPYKSHYREDQKATKRLLGQARRARLDVA